MKTEKYKVTKGIFEGHLFNGTECVIANESRIWDADSMGRSYPKRNCEKIFIAVNAYVMRPLTYPHQHEFKDTDIAKIQYCVHCGILTGYGNGA